MKAIIISIGDELLIGQVVNTNAAFIAAKLNDVGVEVCCINTIGDDKDAILKNFRESYPACNAVVVTGGLGPTHDDITRMAVCEFFDTDLVPHEGVRQQIQRFLQARNRPWSEAAENQTRLPRGAEAIPNDHGTAPGEFFERDGKYFIVMPGVPYEMEAMMNEFVVPFFTQRSSGNYILHRTLNTTGIPESTISERLGDINDLLQGESIARPSRPVPLPDEEVGTGLGLVEASTKVGLAFLPSTGGVRLRITVVGSDRAQCQVKSTMIEQFIRSKVGKYIYGTDEDRLEEVVGRLLTERKLKLAIAESCTGGMLANILTNVPGSSRYVERAIVAYSNQSKMDMLRVSNELLEKYGAVSREVAKAMASGVRTLSGVDIGISTTGVAGPDGGTSEKPVGLVWIGYSDADHNFAVKLSLGSERIRIKERATHACLEIVRRKILDIT